MNLFFLVCMICLVAAPIAFTYFAGSAVIGTLGWLVQTLRISHGANRKLLAARTHSSLAPDDRASARQLLDETALARRSVGARYFLGAVEHQTVHVRTQTCPVNALGQAVSVPLSRQQRRDTQYASCTWILIELQDVLPTNLHLHLQWMPEENVLGSEDLAAGLLDESLQDALQVGDQLLITDGRIGVDSPFGARDGRLEILTQALARAANRLVAVTKAGRVNVAQLLVQTASASGAARPRARAVAHLLKNHPDHPQAEALKASALNDPSADVRFSAARHCGPEGFDTVQVVLFDEEADDALRQHALRYLIRHLPTAPLLQLLVGLIADGPERLRQIAISQIVRLEHHAAIPALMDALGSADLQTQVAATEALGQLAAKDAEPVLRQLLDREELVLQVAAADALGRLGLLSSVQDLLLASQRSGAPRELRLVALSSVHAIRARASGTGAGALSLSAPGGIGLLSVPNPPHEPSQTSASTLTPQGPRD